MTCDLADKTIIGMCAQSSLFLISSTNALPSLFGIIKSVIMISGSICSILSSASSPSYAERVTKSFSKYELMKLFKSAWSSTISICGLPLISAWIESRLTGSCWSLSSLALCTRGNSSVNFVPIPSSDFSSIVPSSNSVYSLTSDKPIPVPSWLFWSIL